MKKLIIYLSVAILVSLLAAGAAFAKGTGGAGEPTGSCPATPPYPTSGPYLSGAFSASVVPGEMGPVVVTHFTLTYGWKTYVFSYWNEITLEDVANLCNLAADNAALLEFFKYAGCSWGTEGVNGAFGLTGTTVIKSIKVLKKDHCGGSENVVSGIVTFRVVP
jgi:hypothetical protein